MNNRDQKSIHDENGDDHNNIRTDENYKHTTTPESTSKCRICKRRIRISAIACRCGDTFCDAHTPHYAHACSFDYKAFGRALITKQNPKLKSLSL